MMRNYRVFAPAAMVTAADQLEIAVKHDDHPVYYGKAASYVGAVREYYAQSGVTMPAVSASHRTDHELSLLLTDGSQYVVYRA